MIKRPIRKKHGSFFSYVLLNEDSQYEYAKNSGDFVVLKSVCDKLAAGEGEEVLGGQNPNGIFIKEMQNEFRKLNTVYDSQLNDAFISAIKAYAAGLSKVEAIAGFRKDVKTAFPEILVD